MGVQIVRFARWEDGVPSETLYTHFEIDALVPRRYHQFSRRIPVNAAKRTDRKKKKKGKRSTYRAEAPAIAEPVQERSILAYNGAQTIGPPTRWTPQRQQVEPDGT